MKLAHLHSQLYSSKYSALSIFLLVFIITIWIYLKSSETKSYQITIHPPNATKATLPKPTGTKTGEQKLQTHINVATVACGKADYLTVLLKSLVLFSQDDSIKLHIIIFSDKSNVHNRKNLLQNLLKQSQKHRLQNFTFEVHPVSFPSSDWEGLKPRCSPQRLFFPSLLPHIESLIYLDMDTVVLGNLSRIWAEFSHMNSPQVIGAAEDNIWSYDSNTKYPFVPPKGLNAGVLLMNLTRLRVFNFEEKITRIFVEYSSSKLLRFGDQDLVNILFSNQTESLYSLRCNMNMILCRCMQVQKCVEVEKEGVFIFHGAGGYFNDTSKEGLYGYIMPWIYNFMKTCKVGDPPDVFFNKMARQYKAMKLACFLVTPDILVKNARDFYHIESATSKLE